MKSFSYVIQDKIGIHARPAGLLVNEVKKYNCEVMMSYNGKRVNCSRLMSVMSLGVKSGGEITIEITGADEETAYKGLMEFFKSNL